MGMGHYVRGSHETCILATRGRFKVRSRAVRSVFEARRGRHSEKPDEFYALVEELADGPYAELFARRRRPGWRCFGKELEP
jgi:N6-adenosine-specific RNA methylase IME4